MTGIPDLSPCELTIGMVIHSVTGETIPVMRIHSLEADADDDDDIIIPLSPKDLLGLIDGLQELFDVYVERQIRSDGP